ncbi:MAG: hypothetical protein PVSMB1_05030 [Gemmatimonadaceae bacterium]
MHPRLDEIKAYLAEVRGQLTAIVAASPPPALTRRPSEAAWSGAEIVHHLGHVEGATTKMLESLFARALADGLPAETQTTSLLHCLDQYHVPDRGKRRIEAPERLRPPRDADLDRACKALSQVRERTLRAVATVDGRDLSAISAPHPVLGVLDGYQWVLFLGQHEARHLNQIKENLTRT